MTPERLSAYHFATASTTLTDRFQNLIPWMDDLSPDLQHQIARPLYQMLTLSEKLDQVALPPRLREQLPTLLNQALPRILQTEGKPPLVNVETARDLLRAIVTLGREYGRFTTWVDGPSPTIADYDRRLAAFGKSHAAFAIIEPYIDSIYRRSVQMEIMQAQAAALNQFTAPAQVVIEAAFSGKRTKQKRLQNAGNVLHHAAGLNEQLLSTYILPAAEEIAVKQAAIEQHLLLIKNDLVGFHGDSPMETARDTVWHGRRIFEKIYPSPDQTRKVIAHLKDLADHFHAQLVTAMPADKADFPPSQMHLLVSLRELDELIYEKLTELGEATGMKSIAERLRQTHETMGMIDMRTQSYQEAIGQFKRAVEISLDQGLTIDDSLFSLIDVFEDRAQSISEAERAYVWRLNIEKRLVPLFTIFNADRESPLLAAEIAVLNRNLQEGKMADNQMRALASAIVWTVEEPSVISLRLLEKVNAGITGETIDAPLKRLQEMAKFFVRGWQERGQYTNEVTALKPYRGAKRAESLMALAGVTERIKKSGQLSPEAAVTTPQAAVRVMVADLQGDHDTHLLIRLTSGQLPPGKAAPIIQRKGGLSPIGDVKVNLDKRTASRWDLSPQADLRDVLLALPNPVSLDDETNVQIAEAVALVAVDSSPQAEQSAFSLQLTTNGAARTLVFKEGQLVGGFITTANQPTIDICQRVGGSNTSNLFEAQPVGGLSPEERVAHGDLVGMFEIVSLPIIIDQRRDGGGGNFSLVPSPPSGGALVLPAIQENGLLGGAIPLESVISDMRSRVEEMAEAIVGVRQGTATVPQFIIYEKTIPEPVYTLTRPTDFKLKAIQDTQTLSFGTRGSSLVPISQALSTTTRLSTSAQFESAAIGTSTRRGTSYGSFNDDFRVREGVALSVLRVSIVAVSPQNASVVVAQLAE